MPVQQVPNSALQLPHKRRAPPLKPTRSNALSTLNSSQKYPSPAYLHASLDPARAQQMAALLQKEPFQQGLSPQTKRLLLQQQLLSNQSSTLLQESAKGGQVHGRLKQALQSRSQLHASDTVRRT